MRSKDKSQQIKITKKQQSKFINSNNSVQKNQSIPITVRSKKFDLQQIDLQAQIFRVFTNEKLNQLQALWKMNQDQICQFFSKYKPFQTQPLKKKNEALLFTLQQQIKLGFTGFTFTGKQLLNSDNLKLVRNEDKLYFGQIINKKRQGMGVSITKNQKYYEGYFDKNERFGNGVQIYPNGNLYIGQYNNNKKHGKGKFFWFDSSSQQNQQNCVQYYEGYWWGGLPQGQGVHKKANGDLYKGTFQNGLKHGKGQQKFANGDFYIGSFVNGTPQGFGQYIWSDGSFYKGNLKQGLRSGYGYWAIAPLPFQNSSEQYKNSSKKIMQNYQGHYQADKKSGYGVYQWQNGWIYKGNFQNDYRNGFGQLFDSNGQLVYKGKWINGQKENQFFQHKKSIDKAKNFQIDGVGKKHNKSQLQNYRQQKKPKSQRYYEANGKTNVFNKSRKQSSKKSSSPTNLSINMKTSKRPMTGSANFNKKESFAKGYYAISTNDEKYNQSELFKTNFNSIIKNRKNRGIVSANKTQKVSVNMDQLNQLINERGSIIKKQQKKNIGKFYMPMQSTRL